MVRLADAAASPRIEPTARRILESQKNSFPWAWFKWRTTPKTMVIIFCKILFRKMQFPLAFPVKACYHELEAAEMHGSRMIVPRGTILFLTPVPAFRPDEELGIKQKN